MPPGQVEKKPSPFIGGGNDLVVDVSDVLHIGQIM